MKKKYSILFVAFIISIAHLSFGQNLIQGKITDGKTGEDIIGATVSIKGTTEATVTDYEGLFKLTTNRNYPLIINISYIGFKPLEITVENKDKLNVKIEEDVNLISEVEIVGQRISEKQKESPLTVESLDLLSIKSTPSSSFYSGLGNLKGVDLTTASLGFTIINTRGFNSTSPVRSLQIIDGVDNQAPGLNFSLGNFLGSSELDVNKVDLVVGASSAFYGPNAFNGVISMETKSPFLHKGLSASLKVGERSLFETAFRWADAIKNKSGHDFFAYKLNFFYLKAYDWEANNYDPVTNSDSGARNPGGFDKVNEYGDEYYSLNDLSKTQLWNYPGMGIWYRKGYKETELVDYNTKNIKSNVAFHFRTRPSQGIESPEFILSSSFGSGTTVYQGDNRFSLRDILFFQNRLEFRKQGRYFIRAYATNEDAGKSFDPYFTALLLQEAAKPNEDWSLDYSRYWLNNIQPKIYEYGYPQVQFVIDPITNQLTTSFDYDGAKQWLTTYHDSLVVWHQISQDYANQANAVGGTQAYFSPDSERFNTEFNKITSTKSNKKNEGSRFYDKSALYHVHGEYKFLPKWTEVVTVGGNFRQYLPKSDGTIFYDTVGAAKIHPYEFGIYGGIDKDFLDHKLKANVSLRVDKHVNFNWIATPAASLVYKVADNSYLRASFSSAIRNPTLTDQYLFLNVGRATLVGNLQGADSLVTIESFQAFRNTLIRDSLSYFNIAPIKPEKVKTFELGYRTTILKNLYIDAGYYYSIYNDFIGYNLGLDIEFDDISAGGLPRNVSAFRYAANSRNQVTTQGFSIGLNYYFAKLYMLGGNYSFNRLNTNVDDPIIPAFNTPENKFNISLSARDIVIKLGKKKIQNFGFSVNYKWIQGFLFEGSPQFTGEIPTYDLLDAQVSQVIPKWKTTIKIGASNILNKKSFQTYGGPRIGRMAYVSVIYDFVNKK
ncbi:MAG: TonB-dependent receptor [Saprospiraceae bacterium]|nr:TonB-dependent receptor [Saprospiraceae bacterium]